MRVTIDGIDMTIDAERLAAEEAAVRAQVREYARGERRGFDIAVTFPGGFVGEVMREMAAIPYGETRTYGDLAAALDTSPVAVGQACGRNPVPIIVPCHRVVGADSLGGFSAGGDRGLELKRRLLDIEASEEQTDLSAFS